MKRGLKFYIFTRATARPRLENLVVMPQKRWLPKALGLPHSYGALLAAPSFFRFRAEVRRGSGLRNVPSTGP